MARRMSLAFLAVASPLLLACFAVGGEVAEVVFVVLVMGFPVALIALAVGEDGILGPRRAPLLLLLLLLEGSGIAMLALRGRVADGPWLAGLPAGAVVLLWGLWLAPLPLVTLTYALTFDRFELGEEDLDRLHESQRRLNGGD